MPKASHDWDMCKTCTHTSNIHKDTTKECRAHECDCEEFVRR